MITFKHIIKNSLLLEYTEEYFLRFQRRPSFERYSAHIDLMEIFIRSENDKSKKNENFLYNLYEDTLNLRKNIDGEDLIELVFKSKNMNDIKKLSQKYPIDGIFVIPENIEKYISKQEIIRIKKQTGMIAASANYGCIYTGKVIDTVSDG